MAAMKLYFVLFLFFAFASARPYYYDDDLPMEVHEASTETTVPTKENRSDIQDQNNVVTTSRPAQDGSYIQVYQKNEYHNNGAPAKLITIYKKCSENGTCKNIHYLEIALTD